MAVFTGTVEQTEKCLRKYISQLPMYSKEKWNIIWDKAGNAMNLPDGSSIYLTQPQGKQIIIVEGKAKEYFKSMEVII